ncbi:MAG: hypothetical protein ACTSQY_00460 [Candidatus Odinarchaeia archaeon]|nr:MAG: hypothetical protein [Lokiarchaeota virus Fenrir Meg22_1012]URC17273.1 MAG: hypothetical protein [Lokiarchaeota virus Fenrir Meg22_1214]
MKISKFRKPYEQYFFSSNNPNFGNKTDNCKYCSNKLDPKYTEIIKRMRKQGILHPEYEEMCCDCAFIKTHLGFLKCPKCNSTLRIMTIRITSEETTKLICCGLCVKIYKEI